MAREMRRAERQLTHEQTMELVAKGKTGTLALNGDGGYPYALPVNYVYYNGNIYIHGAKEGYKVDLIGRDPRACFSCYVSEEIVPEKLTSLYASFIAEGKAVMVEETAEKRAVLEFIVEELSGPEFREKGAKLIDKMIDKTGIIRFSIEEIKGKAHGK